MISAGEFRNGVTFELDGNVFQIVEFQHVKPGKGAAFVRTKLKNVITGAVVEKTFRPTEKMPKAHIERMTTSIYIQTANCITLWIRKHSSRCRLTKRLSVIRSNS